MASSTSLELAQSFDNTKDSQETNYTIKRMDSKLFQAAVNGEIEVIKNANKLQLGLLLTPEENTVLHVNIIASKTTDEATFLEGIMDMCPPLLMQKNTRGETPLHMAARYGHDLVVRFLINRAKLLEQNDLERNEVVKHKMMRMKNEEDDTALHEAVRFQHLEVVRILTTEDPHFSYSANKSGETPLYMAVEGEHLDLVNEILNNCSSPAAGGPIGRTALHAAVLAKNAGLTRMILEKVTNLTKQADEDGLIPLHYAATSFNGSNLEIVKMLLEKDESSAYIKAQNGITALHVAAINHTEGYEIMKEIMSRCPDSYEVVDNDGRNFLHYAVTRQSLSTLKLILQHSSLTNYLLNRKDNAGNTPLLSMISKSPRHPENLEALLSHPRVNKMLFNNQNNNILDIANDLDYEEYKERGLSKLFRKCLLTKSYLRKSFLKDKGGKPILTDLEKKKERKERLRTKIANYRASTLVAATLIATVTFTAGFTLPGGYVSDDFGNQQQGSAVLRNNIAFQAFMITDTIALVLSTTAVFINLFLTIASLGHDEKEKFINNYMVSMNLTIFAMGFMVIAFVTGTYAVLSLSAVFAITTCLIGLSYFVLLFFITKEKFIRMETFGKFPVIIVG